MSTEKVLIVGASGRQGCSVARALEPTKKYELFGLVRDTSSTEVKALVKDVPSIKLTKADLNDAKTLVEPFKGIDIVYLMTCFGTKGCKDAEKEYQQGVNAIDAAKAAGVKYIVWSSLENTKTLSGGKFELAHFDGKSRVDDYLTKSGIDYTIIRLSCYMENFIRFHEIVKLPDGTFTTHIPMGTTPMYVMSVCDVGGVVQSILADRKSWSKKTIGLATEALPLKTLVEEMSKATGKTITYTPVTPSTFQKQNPVMAQVGEMYEFMEQFPLKRDISTTKKLNSSLTSFADWAKKNAKELIDSAVTMKE